MLLFVNDSKTTLESFRLQAGDKHSEVSIHVHRNLPRTRLLKKTYKCEQYLLEHRTKRKLRKTDE